ncbi:Vacuolar membrane protease, partial [Thoreauomyces humboldtii]
TAEFTLKQLQQELRSRNLSIGGSKDVLIARLEAYDETAASKSNGRPVSTTIGETDMDGEAKPVSILNRRSSRETIELRRNELATARNALSLWRSPLLFTKYLGLYVISAISLFIDGLFNHEWIVAGVVSAIVWAVAIYRADGPHQEGLRDIEANIVWYGWWLMLGVASSIGLGTGLHTFVLFLGPHIAHVTLTAYQCQTLDFNTRGPDSFKCDMADTASRSAAAAAALTVWQIAKKVRWESFFWGMGTSFGELPPYFVAKAAAEAGRDDQGLDSIESLITKPRHLRTFGERVQIFMYNLMQSLGFFGILLCASIPNPLFDLAGIVCGSYGVPFLTFFGATFLGKAVFKSSIQTISVILMLSEESLSFILAELKRFVPPVHSVVQNLLDEQVKRYQRPHDKDDGDEKFNYIGAVWNAVLAGMIGYFAYSLLSSIAVSQMKKQQEVELTALKNTLESDDEVAAVTVSDVPQKSNGKAK